MTNGHNDWGVEFTRIKFLEQVLGAHANVLEFTRERDILFTVKRQRQNDSLTILCCDEYTFGLAAGYRGLNEFGKIDIFFVGGTWNYYTPEAKSFCIESKIGLFNARELSGAIWRDDYWNYFKKDSEGNPVYYYRSA
jgi:hypothetical protein